MAETPAASEDATLIRFGSYLWSANAPEERVVDLSAARQRLRRARRPAWVPVLELVRAS